MKSFLIALSFLTTIPVRPNIESNNELAKSADSFMLVAHFKAIILALSSIISLYTMGRLPAAITVILMAELLSGGLHSDGLADTIDALGIKPQETPQKTREKRLTVLKDPATGAMGSLSLSIWALTCFAALATLSETSSLLTAAAIIAPIQAISAIKTCMYKSKPATHSLSSIFLPYKSPMIILDHIAAFITSTAALCFSFSLFVAAISATILSILTLTTSLIIKKNLTKKLGGINGDVLGATHQICFAISLLTLSAIDNLTK
ncbi:adenosylcobinamide-GDP ribazoletransferase [Spirochaetia bacterium 38H-sp]|uniref:Adenosylcobinamide-GDP ribazoletransferase n=1 Tax=Rarispira pelagica TaxID=3141764 RepID=A0ABU9UCK3_9SPIR